MPGRERDFDAAFKQALDYIVAIGGSAMHCLAGKVPPEQRPAAEKTFIANLTRAADLAKPQEHHAADRADQPARPAGLFPQPGRACRRHHRQGRPAERARSSSIFITCRSSSGDLIKRFEKHLPLVGHVQIAAVPSRHEPDEGEINYPAVFEALDRLGWAGWVACEYRPRGAHRGRARLGAVRTASCADESCDTIA